jgi:PRC-barrel domain protein
VADRDGIALGTVRDLLVDTTTNRPAWLVIALEGGPLTVAPAAGSRPTARGTRLARTAGEVRACPVALASSELGREHVVRVCRHYGVRPPAGTWHDAVRPVGAAPPPAVAVAA